MLNASYLFGLDAYTTNDIKYVWSETPIVMEAGSKLRPKFSIESIRNESCTSSTNTGNVLVDFSDVMR